MVHDRPPIHPIPFRQPFHVVRHSGACGERIPSPHPACQAKAEPYRAAELASVTFAGPVDGIRTHVVILRCHGCGVTMQYSEATA